MKKVLALIVGLMLFNLVGCSTQGELKAERTGVKLTSLKESKAITTCLIEGFESLTKTAVAGSKPTQNGYSVSLTFGVAMGRDTAMLVEVENTPTGSESTYFSKVVVGEGKLIQVIAQCQK